MLRRPGSAGRPRLLALASALTLGLALSAPPDARAQAPSTDIWLVPVHAPAKAGEPPRPGAPQKLTDREGYDNQPAFLPGQGGLLYTSEIDGQTDIQRYDLHQRTRHVVRTTAESEYSPTPIENGHAISVVRIEADGSTQRLWRLALAGDAKPRLLVPDVQPVGYHAWVDRARVLLFVLGEPATLELATLGKAGTRVLAHDIGRGLARIPGSSRMSFVQKRGQDDWWVTAVDPDDGSLESLIRLPAGQEDFAWAPDHSLWTGEGGSLLRWQPGSELRWQEVVDFSAKGIAGISRLAWRDDGRMLALVAQRPAEGPPPEAER